MDETTEDREQERTAATVFVHDAVASGALNDVFGWTPMQLEALADSYAKALVGNLERPESADDQLLDLVDDTYDQDAVASILRYGGEDALCLASILSTCLLFTEEASLLARYVKKADEVLPTMAETAWNDVLHDRRDDAVKALVAALDSVIAATSHFANGAFVGKTAKRECAVYLARSKSLRESLGSST